MKKPPEQTQKNFKLRDHSPHRRLSKASENGGRERVVVAQGRRRLRPSPFLFSVSFLRFFAAVSLQVELLVLGQRSHDLAREKEKKPPPMLWPRCGSVRHSDVGLHGDGGLHGNCATVIIGKNLDRSTHPNTIRNSPPLPPRAGNNSIIIQERKKE